MLYDIKFLLHLVRSRDIVIQAFLLGNSPCYVFVGHFDLLVCRTGVDELVTSVSVLQVPPHPGQLFWDVKVAELLRHNLPQGEQCCVALGGTDISNSYNLVDQLLS